MDLAATPPELAVPQVVQVEPVGRRKLATRGPGVPPAFMTFDAFCRLVGKLCPPLALHLSGDQEPLLHPRFFDMVAVAAARGLDVSATTRLPGLTANRAEECVQSGLHRLHVVLGGEPSALLLRSLRRLAEAKRRLQSATPGIVLVSANPGERLRVLADELGALVVPAVPDAAPAARVAFSGQALSGVLPGA
jgi:hypothetical protein